MVRGPRSGPRGLKVPTLSPSFSARGPCYTRLAGRGRQPRAPGGKVCHERPLEPAPANFAVVPASSRRSMAVGPGTVRDCPMVRATPAHARCSRTRTVACDAASPSRACRRSTKEEGTITAGRVHRRLVTGSRSPGQAHSRSTTSQSDADMSVSAALTRDMGIRAMLATVV